MATYAIGDVQGCMLSLSRLVDRIGFNPAKDTLWFVGDLVNRGPDSLSVLRYIRGLGSAAVTVLGNHDLHLLAIASGATPLRPKDTLQHVLNAPDVDGLLTWLRHQPLLHQENGFVLIHAGLLPQWTALQAARFAGEVEQVLRGDGYQDFLRCLYSVALPDRWTEDLQGTARLGVITNVLTKLRVCTTDGVMNLSFKTEPVNAPAGFRPWFKVPNRRSAGATIISGHWAALGLHMDDNIIAVDSGCVWGRALTAVRLEDRQVFQVPYGE